jgi:4'-phosphopantetheinyl transferase
VYGKNEGIVLINEVFAIARLFILPITSITPEVVTEGLTYLSQEKRARLHRFRHREDLIRGLMADLLLRSRIIEDLHMDNASIRFELNSYGKPRLSGVSNYHFNVSHSGDWVVCLVDNEPVGVDVERVQAFEEGIARSFFAEDEYRFVLEGAQERERQLRFYRIWTAKESYIKAVGKGISLPLTDFSVVTSEGVEGIKLLGGEAWQISSNELNWPSGVNTNTYYVTTCCRSSSEIKGPECVDVNQIITALRSVNR